MFACLESHAVYITVIALMAVVFVLRYYWGRYQPGHILCFVYNEFLVSEMTCDKPSATLQSMYLLRLINMAMQKSQIRRIHRNRECWLLL